MSVRPPARLLTSVFCFSFITQAINQKLRSVILTDFPHHRSVADFSISDYVTQISGHRSKLQYIYSFICEPTFSKICKLFPLASPYKRLVSVFFKKSLSVSPLNCWWEFLYRVLQIYAHLPFSCEVVLMRPFAFC